MWFNAVVSIMKAFKKLIDIYSQRAILWGAWLKVYYYPEGKDESSDRRTGYQKVEKLTKNHPRIWTLFKATMVKVEKKGLEDYKKLKWVKPLKGVKAPIQELRIPKTRKGGVLRLYFADLPDKSGDIIVLSEEFKTIKKASPEVIKLAEKRYKERYK